MVPLTSVVQVDERVAPRELNHFGQRRAVTIRQPGARLRALGEALQWMDDTAAHPAASCSTDYDGQSREFRTSAESLRSSSCSRSAFIYLVLAAQFESFRDPFIIMLTVPLSMTALSALWLTGGMLNVRPARSAWLVGLITKQRHPDRGSSPNQLREQAETLKAEAVVEAGLRHRGRS